MDELGDFLRTRRARLRPEDVGLTSYGARRVPGLRREELAQLAGVSATYYTRLEQGQSPNASDAVLDSIARALRLDDDERAHLHHLARPVRRKSRRKECVRPGTRQLISAIESVAAIVVDRRTDVLAWNRLGHALLGHHVETEHPNLTRMLFLDPRTRELYPHWDEEARRAVSSLRLVAGSHPDDRQLSELVGELAVNSPEFTALWARHPVQTCVFGTKQFRHPLVGDLELAFEVMRAPDDSGQRILMYSAESGSSSEAALRLLAVDLPEVSVMVQDPRQ